MSNVNGRVIPEGRRILASEGFAFELQASSFELRALSRVESSRVKFVDLGGLIRIKLDPGLKML